MERPLGYLLEEGAERRRRDPSAPLLAADPVADQPPLLALPADDVAGHFAVGLDRAVDGVGSRADVLPMREERLLVPGRDAGHGDAFGVALMLEEDGQVGVDDGSQFDVHIWEDRIVSRAPTARSEELRALAQRLADALPAGVVEEVVVTGSVSRGVADEVSDVEMLVVTSEPLELAQAFGYARAAGLTGLDSWGPQGGPDRRTSGYYEGIPFELVWWPRKFTEARVDALAAGEPASSAEALVSGIALRSSGLLPVWQERLRVVPDEIAAARIEEAALPWGGFTPAGLLTIIRPGERLSLTEWIFDGALRVLAIVYALNRVPPATTKRLATRVEPLAIKPERLAEQIEEALSEQDLRRALLVMTELQLDTVRLAPSGPNVDRARTWLAEGAALLREAR